MLPRPGRVSFAGGGGHQLAARLDLPAEPPRALAVFAHCFTCSKDLRAASHVAAGLTRAGIGVLRFDFTGLGASEGEFADTGFGSNVDDLVAAADWLRAEHAAPQLLVGHSLGGAAVVSAASRIPEVRAVATIGAPSETEHVTELFDEHLDTIAEQGDAEVCLAGRSFRVSQQMVDDLRRGRVTDAAAAFTGALLILHSPIDNSVGIEHAETLYRAARHPKSFVALDRADHLLTNERHAQYVADVIGAWAACYLDEADVAPPPRPTAQVVVAETLQGRFLNHVVVGDHRLLADEPPSVGGLDAGPSPYDLLGAALGACTSMTLRMYAERKGIAVDRIGVEVSHDHVHADDAGDDRATRIDRFTRVLHLEGDLESAVLDRLEQIADMCPVHRTLERSSRIVTHRVDRRPGPVDTGQAPSDQSISG